MVGLEAVARNSSGQFLRWYSSTAEHHRPDTLEVVVALVEVAHSSSGRTLR